MTHLCAVAPADQVTRLGDFEAAHPGVAITYTGSGPSGYWRAEGRDADGAIRVIVEYDLRLLLNQLDQIRWQEDPA